MDNINNSLCEEILALSKEKSAEEIKNHLNNFDDAEVFSALCALRSESNEKIDLLCAEYLECGRGCKKSQTEAGNIYAKIVSYLEKRNSFPCEYAIACYRAANLLYDKAKAFELNLGFAIDYDRRGSINGKSIECQKRYETNIEFLKSLLPGKYPNEESLYKVAAFILSDRDKKQVLDNYWNSLKEKAQNTQKAYFLKFFSHSSSPEILLSAEDIIKKNHSFPDGSELYQKEETKKMRPSITASGERKSEFFSKISAAYLEYDSALSELFKTRAACDRKEQHANELGEQSFEFWCDEDKVSRALDILKRQETYGSVFGLRPPEFWENDALFFKYVDALGRKEKFRNILGENSWDFWLSQEKVENALSAFSEKQSAKLKKDERNQKIKKSLKKIMALFFSLILLCIFFSFVLNSILKRAFLSFLIAFVLSIAITFLLFFKLKKINKRP